MTDQRRRKFNKLLGTGTALIPLSALLSTPTATAAPVDPASAPAKALSFTLQSKKEGQYCSSCLFFTSGDDEKGKCIVFGNSEVPSTGWCTSYQMKKSP